MTLQVNHLQLLNGNEQMICIKTEIPEEICEIDDELKAIYPVSYTHLTLPTTPYV